MLSLPVAAVTSTCQLHGRDSSHVTALQLAAGCVYRCLGFDPVKPVSPGLSLHRISLCL